MTNLVLRKGAMSSSVFVALEIDGSSPGCCYGVVSFSLSLSTRMYQRKLSTVLAPGEPCDGQSHSESSQWSNAKRQRLLRFFRALKFESAHTFTSAKFVWKRCMKCPDEPNFVPTKLVGASYFILNTRSPS